MNFRWNDDTVRWYLAADAYTGYSEKLAALIAPMVEGLSTLCDVGCGLGLIDLALSRHLKKITCIDVSAAAIDALKQAVAVKKIGNVEPLLMDSADLGGRWDVILLSFFDSHNIGAYLPQCRKLIAVVGTKGKSELFPDKYRTFRKYTAGETEEFLVQNRLPYKRQYADLDFGQPLLSLRDARKFVAARSPGITPEDLEAFLSERLVETGDRLYPYCLPRTKSVGIFEVKGDLQNDAHFSDR